MTHVSLVSRSSRRLYTTKHHRRPSYVQAHHMRIVHCKNIRISVYGEFSICLNRTGSVYAYTSVNRRNNEARGPTPQWTSLFRRFMDTDANVYVNGSVKVWKIRHKISVDIRIIFTVYRPTLCIATSVFTDSRPTCISSGVVLNFCLGKCLDPFFTLLFLSLPRPFPSPLFLQPLPFTFPTGANN